MQYVRKPHTWYAQSLLCEPKVCGLRTNRPDCLRLDDMAGAGMIRQAPGRGHRDGAAGRVDTEIRFSFNYCHTFILAFSIRLLYNWYRKMKVQKFFKKQKRELVKEWVNELEDQTWKNRSILSTASVWTRIWRGG